MLFGRKNRYASETAGQHTDSELLSKKSDCNPIEYVDVYYDDLLARESDIGDKASVQCGILRNPMEFIASVPQLAHHHVLWLINEPEDGYVASLKLFDEFIKHTSRLFPDYSIEPLDHDKNVWVLQHKKHAGIRLYVLMTGRPESNGHPINVLHVMRLWDESGATAIGAGLFTDFKVDAYIGEIGWFLVETLYHPMDGNRRVGGKAPLPFFNHINHSETMMLVNRTDHLPPENEPGFAEWLKETYGLRS